VYPLSGTRRYPLTPLSNHILLMQVSEMGSLIRDGKIRHWGVSNETSFGLMKMIEAAKALKVPPPVTIQNNYSLLQRGFEGDLAEACAKNNISLLPWSPLAGGALTGKYLLDNVPSGRRFDLWPSRYTRFNTKRVKRAVELYSNLASTCGLTCAELSLSFLRSKWFISSTLIGAVSLRQLKENLKVFDATAGVTLTEEILKKIEEIHVELRNPALED
jgi:aryl-alcohol dehydrogenase-like predicted oxidoreductase